jgi:hypothetical protein
VHVMRRLLLLAFTLSVSCSRETPAPPVTETTPAPQSAAPAPSITNVAPVADKGTYDEAMIWLKSAPGFRFTLQDHGVSLEGEMKRPRVGVEQVTFKADGAEWRGEAGVRGVVWSTRSGGGWKEATPPDYAGRVFQRVTFAFDPQKKEGSAQLASSDATSNLYRFTDANTGLVHQVRVSKSDAHIQSMRIGDEVELTVQP